jgi:hypothetical protein
MRHHIDLGDTFAYYHLKSRPTGGSTFQIQIVSALHTARATLAAEALHMRIHARFTFVAIAFLLTAPWPTRGDDTDDARIRKSVVKILSSLRQPDPFRP